MEKPAIEKGRKKVAVARVKGRNKPHCKQGGPVGWNMVQQAVKAAFRGRGVRQSERMETTPPDRVSLRSVGVDLWKIVDFPRTRILICSRVMVVVLPF